jgi:hypothetical protein
LIDVSRITRGLVWLTAPVDMAQSIRNSLAAVQLSAAGHETAVALPDREDLRQWRPAPAQIIFDEQVRKSPTPRPHHPNSGISKELAGIPAIKAVPN